MFAFVLEETVFSFVTTTKGVKETARTLAFAVVLAVGGVVASFGLVLEQAVLAFVASAGGVEESTRSLAFAVSVAVTTRRCRSIVPTTTTTLASTAPTAFPGIGR